MAARMRKTHQDDVWRFYVYDVLDEKGNVIYVGKGSGNRFLASQRERGGHTAQINAFFRKELDSYAYEVQRIAELNPPLNVHKGGNGSKASVVKKPRLTLWEKEVSKCGTRVYAARMLLSFRNGINSLIPKVDVDWATIEKVAYGNP